MCEESMWIPRHLDRESVVDALVEARIGGPVPTTVANVRAKMVRLIDGHPTERLGLPLDAVSREELAALLRDEAGLGSGPPGEPWVDPGRLYDRLAAAGVRLASAADRGETVLLATGHPVGLSYLYMSIASVLEEAGARVVRPADGSRWQARAVSTGPRSPAAVAKRLARAALSRAARAPARRGIAYLGGVGVVTDGRSALHTHSGEAMERMLGEVRPDLVIGDHGLAGTAISSGIDTIAVADVNDPALMLAHRAGLVDHLIVMDDNSAPNAYWPCFQVLAEPLERRSAGRREASSGLSGEAGG
jgi:hypothetical protein